MLKVILIYISCYKLTITRGLTKTVENINRQCQNRYQGSDYSAGIMNKIN